MSLNTLQDHEQLWNTIKDRQAKQEAERVKPPDVRIWDGDYRFRGECAGWRSIEYEFVENDTGTATLKLPTTNYIARWIMNFKGRSKRNVHITIDKQGTRWSGFMHYYKIVRTKELDIYLEVVFLHDYEQLKHVYCWSNPFLRPEIQFPKLWAIFGPARWCLMVTLFCNHFRLETSLWTIPDDPTDITEWLPFSLDVSRWRNIIKPFSILDDKSAITIVFSRFKSFHNLAKDELRRNQLTVNCRRYLRGEDPHPFRTSQGELFKINERLPLEQLFPLRHGALVWDIIDNSDWKGTSFGGSLLTGLIRAIVNISDDGYTEGIDIFTGDYTYPSQYYVPWFLGTSPEAPWVVFEDSELTGIESYEFKYREAGAVNMLAGGQSMPGVFEGISAAVNLGGDFVTSIINTLISFAGSASVGGGVIGVGTMSVPSIDLPPLGGLIDAVAKLLYENVFLAFMEIPTLRAVESNLPLPGLDKFKTGLGDFHLFEDWADGADRAFTISAFAAIRKQMFDTQAQFTNTVKVPDAAPYRVGENGYGHFFLGSRVGTTVRDFPTPYTVFVARITKLGYSWDEEGSKGWSIEMGHQPPEDAALKALQALQELNNGLSDFGLF